MVQISSGLHFRDFGDGLFPLSPFPFSVRSNLQTFVSRFLLSFSPFSVDINDNTDNTSNKELANTLVVNEAKLNVGLLSQCDPNKLCHHVTIPQEEVWPTLFY
jgi:hypothetical protein